MLSKFLRITAQTQEQAPGSRGSRQQGGQSSVYACCRPGEPRGSPAEQFSLSRCPGAMQKASEACPAGLAWRAHQPIANFRRTRAPVQLLRRLSLGEVLMSQTFAIGIGGAAGQGIATPGDIFAKIFSRRGLHLNAYNAYQSIIRGGHTFLTIRTGADEVTSLETMDLLIPLNQDTMDRHLRLLTAGGACIYTESSVPEGGARAPACFGRLLHRTRRPGVWPDAHECGCTSSHHVRWTGAAGDCFSGTMNKVKTQSGSVG